MTVARILPLDLDLARAGYLRLPDGAQHHVLGLDRIAADTDALGARVWWADLPGDHPGFCHCESRQILLAPWLFDGDPVQLRSVWTEELAHVVVGPSEEKALEWQRRRYGELLESPEVA